MGDTGTLASDLSLPGGVLLLEADEVVGEGRVHDEVLRTGVWDGPRGGAPGGVAALLAAIGDSGTPDHAGDTGVTGLIDQHLLRGAIC